MLVEHASDTPLFYLIRNAFASIAIAEVDRAPRE